MMTTQQKIRSVRKNFYYWMSQRQPNFFMAGTDHQQFADKESMRLAGVLEKLEAQHREDMARIAAAESTN